MAVKSFTLSQIAWYRTMKEAFAQRGLDVDAFFQQCGNGAKPSSELEVGYLSDLFSCAWCRLLWRWTWCVTRVCA
jgi:hypothetical protein